MTVTSLYLPSYWHYSCCWKSSLSVHCCITEHPCACVTGPISWISRYQCYDKKLLLLLLIQTVTEVLYLTLEVSHLTHTVLFVDTSLDGLSISKEESNYELYSVSKCCIQLRTQSDLLHVLEHDYHRTNTFGVIRGSWCQYLDHLEVLCHKNFTIT